MLISRKVAITGGLSCGKSSVCRILKDLGAYVVSADNIVHQLLSSDANLGQKIVQLLGQEVILETAVQDDSNRIIVDRKLDRSKIAQIVFHNLKLLKALEELVHPAVYREINKEYQRQKQLKNPSPLFVAEVPLLFESEGQKYFDKTIAVIAHDEICRSRFLAMGHNEEDFNNRMANQLPLSQKTLHADYVINNNGTLLDLQKTTRELYKNLLS